MRYFFSLFAKSEAGVAAVEFALIAPILILLMVGLTDMGLYIKSRMQLEQISRASVDYVMQGGDENNIGTDVLNYYDAEHATSYSINTERFCTCADGETQDCSALNCGAGDYSRQYFQVTLNRTVSTLFPYPGIPDELQLQGSARMRLD